MYIFQAGLLSIVIAIFTTQSFQSLEEDPSGTSTQLLAQISQQLSSFTAVGSFLNSTTPAISQGILPFTASIAAVQINTLWVVSLALSLVAAIFAIAVKHWIRRVPVSQHMSERDCVRLRQFRYIGLNDWQVPTIIAFLPLLLQLAVILFLIGLIILLWSLNQGVALAFTIVAAISFSFFLITALIPAIISNCPYKSPLVPTLMSLIQAVAVPLLLLACGMLLVFTYVVGPFFALLHRIFSCICSYNSGLFRLVEAIASFRATLEGWLKTWAGFMRSDFANVERFWSGRELNALPPIAVDLERSAVAWAPYGVPRPDFSRVQDCFEDLTQMSRTRCALQWAGLNLGDFHWHDLHDYSPYCLVNPKMLPKVDLPFTKGHRDVLVNALPKDWSTHEWMKEDPSIAGILTLLMETTNADKKRDINFDFLTNFTRLLLTIRDNQTQDQGTDMQPAHFVTASARVPTALIFESFVHDDYPISRGGMYLSYRLLDRQLTSSNIGPAQRSLVLLPGRCASWVVRRPWDQRPVVETSSIYSSLY